MSRSAPVSSASGVCDYTLYVDAMSMRHHRDHIERSDWDPSQLSGWCSRATCTPQAARPPPRSAREVRATQSSSSSEMTSRAAGGGRWHSRLAAALSPSAVRPGGSLRAPSIIRRSWLPISAPAAPPPPATLATLAAPTPWCCAKPAPPCNASRPLRVEPVTESLRSTVRHIQSSTVPSAKQYCTCTQECCPMRCARSSACHRPIRRHARILVALRRSLRRHAGGTKEALRKSLMRHSGGHSGGHWHSGGTPGHAGGHSGGPPVAPRHLQQEGDVPRKLRKDDE